MEKRNLHGWMSFLSVMLLLTGIGIAIAWIQYQNGARHTQRIADNRLSMLTLTLKKSLELGDYARIQPLFDEWGKYHHDAIQLELIARNGFLYGHYHRDQSSSDRLQLQVTIPYGYEGEATLFYVHDASDAYRDAMHTIAAIIFALLIVYLFSFVVFNRNRKLKLLSQQIHQRNEDLKAEHSLLQSVIDSLPELIYFKSLKGEYQGCNREYRKFHGMQQEQIRGKTDLELLDGMLAQFNHDRDRAIIASRHPLKGEAWQRSVDNRQLLMDTLHTPYFDDNGNMLGMIGISRDITRLRRFQENLEDLAYHDPLTGLPNRLYLGDRMQKDMAKAKRSGCKLAICTIDLDGFKPINDEFGHAVGDHVLVEIASRLRDILRQEDTAARWGGDEFTLLLNDISNEADRIDVTLHRIQEAISLPIKLAEGQQVRLSCSIGITLYPDDDQDADTLLRHADQAMYHAKQHGKNQYTFFDSEQDRSIHTQTRNLVRLMRAIDDGELHLLYQPQINMRDGSLHGVEALLRWQHPDQGLLSPISFLPPPDNQSANIKLDNWVLQSALKQLALWQQRGIVRQVGVNLSASSLQDPMFYNRLCEMLETHPEAAGQLQLEVLESTSMNDITKVAKVIENCRQVGISFALDDFGTGYSSLTYLRRLPADTIKIDRSFVIDMLEDENDLIIVNGIIKLADAFSKEVVAEGVETVEQGQRLLELGGVLVQGYGIARPMPADEIEDWFCDYRLPLQWQSQSLKSRPG